MDDLTKPAVVNGAQLGTVSLLLMIVFGILAYVIPEQNIYLSIKSFNL